MYKRMKHGSDRSDGECAHQRDAADGVAPGKRTLTGSSPAVQRSATAEPNATGAPGRTMSEIIPVSSDVSFADSLVADTPVQRKVSSSASDADVHALAEHGTSGAAGALPFMDQIQRSFGNHDVSGIKAHADGAAVDASRAMGAHAFASGNHVAFGTPPDLHTAAHEAAHVVQQQSGVQLKGGVGEVGDRYEQQADLVADAVVRGESAEQLLGPAMATRTNSPAVQRFAADEHQQLGDKGSGNAMVELAPGYRLPFGDVVALAGDHFESIEQMRRFAVKREGKESRNEIEWARMWKLNAPSVRAWSDAEARESQERRYYELAGRNQSHFVAPREKDRGASPAESSGIGNDRGELAAARFMGGLPKNAPAGYRSNHIRAIYEAFEAGRADVTGTATAGGGSAVPTLEAALASEAFACHFLTDSFAGGHVRTARQDLKSHWDPRVPMFFHNLVGLMGDLIGHELHTRGAYGALSQHFLAGQARSMINAELAKKASFTLGDLVAGALHHQDNVHGVIVQAGGSEAHLVGDGELKRGGTAANQTTNLATTAVRSSVAEVRQAHALGSIKGKSPIEVIEGFLAHHKERFAAETFVPDASTVDESRSPEAKWRVDSIEQLFDDPVFVSGAKIFLKEQKAELIAMANSDKLKGAKGDALIAGVADELTADPIGLLRRVVNWTPGSGHSNSWESKNDSSDYVDQADKLRATDTLTLAQRISLVRTLTEELMPEYDQDNHRNMERGVRKGSEDRPALTILKLLDTASRKDVTAIIQAVGYDAIARLMTADLWPVFANKYPASAHAAR